MSTLKTLLFGAAGVYLSGWLALGFLIWQIGRIPDVYDISAFLIGQWVATELKIPQFNPLPF